jgi:hypothetical protein
VTWPSQLCVQVLKDYCTKPGFAVKTE